MSDLALFLPFGVFAHGRHCRFVPKYFESDIESGIPKLTEAGRRALEEEMQEDSLHALEPIPEAVSV